MDIKELIHSAAVAVREMKKDIDMRRWDKIYELLSKEENSKALLSAVNAILSRYGESPVDKVNGFGLLALDEVLRQEEICSRCADPRSCPSKGSKAVPKVYERGIFLEWPWCEKYYRMYLICEIEEMAGKELPELIGKSTEELVMLQEKLSRLSLIHI